MVVGPNISSGDLEKDHRGRRRFLSEANTELLRHYGAGRNTEKIDYKEMQVVSKTVAAIAWTLGNQEWRPQLKSNLPDQLVKDMNTAKDQGWGKITPVLSPLPGMPF